MEEVYDAHSHELGANIRLVKIVASFAMDARRAYFVLVAPTSFVL